jgi:hypothetical protein
MPYFDTDHDVDPNYGPCEDCDCAETGEEREAWRQGDLVLTLYRAVEGQDEPLFLTVVVVGGATPWATCHCGHVVTGPTHEDYTLLCCGVQENTLPWNDGNYWVLEAVGEDGGSVTLSPAEYRDMLATAAVMSPGMRAF